MHAQLDSEPLAQTDYAVVVDSETLLPIETIERPAVVLLAVRVGATRLIDNIVPPIPDLPPNSPCRRIQFS